MGCLFPPLPDRASKRKPLVGVIPASSSVTVEVADPFAATPSAGFALTDSCDAAPGTKSTCVVTAENRAVVPAGPDAASVTVAPVRGAPTVPDPIRARLAAASVAELDTWLDSLLDATSLEEVFRHRSPSPDT